jgi:hypothetical protein
VIARLQRAVVIIAVTAEESRADLAALITAIVASTFSIATRPTVAGPIFTAAISVALLLAAGLAPVVALRVPLVEAFDAVTFILCTDEVDMDHVVRGRVHCLHQAVLASIITLDGEALGKARLITEDVGAGIVVI